MKYGVIDLEVTNRHIIIIVEDIKDQGCELLPCLSREEAASIIMDIESGTCRLNNLLMRG